MKGNNGVTRHEFLKTGIGVFAGLAAWSRISRGGNRADAAEGRAVSPQTATRAPDPSKQSLRVNVSVDEEESKQVMALLKQVGAEKPEKLQQRGLTGVETVLVAILVASAVSNLIIKLLPLWKCGVVVDTRGSTVRTQKNCDLGRGTVLVVKSDGTETKLHEPTEVQMEAVLANLAK